MSFLVWLRREQERLNQRRSQLSTATQEAISLYGSIITINKVIDAYEDYEKRNKRVNK